jgi:hypothetical protein
MATVIIPTPLRKFTENNARLETDETTVQSALRSLSEKYPDLRRHLFDDAGNIRPFLNIFVGRTISATAIRAKHHWTVTLSSALFPLLPGADFKTFKTIHHGIIQKYSILPG